MANKNSKRTSSRGGAGIAVVIVSTLLALIVAAYFVLSVFVFRSWNPMDWTKDKNEVKPAGQMVIEFDPTGADAPIAIVPKSDNEISATSEAIAPTSEAIAPASLAGNSVTLSCKITPDDATIKTVTWGAAWSDSSASWAQGKNVLDYVQIVPQSEGALSATVNCLQAFGAQISIIVTSDDKEDGTISATCKAQYAKRIEAAELMIVSFRETDYGDYDSGWLKENYFEQTKSQSDAFDMSYDTNFNKYNESPEYEYDKQQYGIKLNITSESIGTVEEGVLIEQSQGNSDARFQGSSTVSNLSVKIELADGVASEVQSSLGVGSLGSYSVINGCINMPQAFKDILGNVEGSRVYNVLQPYYNSGTHTFQIKITFNGKSNTAYEFKYGIKLNCTPLRNAVQGLYELAPEIIL